MVFNPKPWEIGSNNIPSVKYTNIHSEWDKTVHNLKWVQVQFVCPYGLRFMKKFCLLDFWGDSKYAKNMVDLGGFLSFSPHISNNFCIIYFGE